MATILMIRIACIATTTFSVPSILDIGKCAKLQELSSLDRFHKAMLSFVGLGMSYFCGDYVFSGHTSTITLCCCFIRYYFASKYKLAHALINCVMLILNIFAMFCIVWAKQHYTVDVILGFVLSNFLFIIYHNRLESIVARKQQKSGQVISNFGYLDKIFTPCVGLLESDVKSVENKYDWKPFVLIGKFFRLLTRRIRPSQRETYNDFQLELEA